MKNFLTHAGLSVALLCATSALTACNEHVVDGCRPECSSSDSFEALFAMCVAYGTDACRAGNRECCSLEAGCRGEIGDQVVTVRDAEMCVDLTVAECLPPCAHESYGFQDDFATCLDAGDCLSPSPEVCCAQMAGCVGRLGGVSIITDAEGCCSFDSDCPDGTICDSEETWTCVDAACVAEMCGFGRECVGGQCLCHAQDGTQVLHCPPGEICEGGGCYPLNPCATLTCPSGTECVYGECLEPCSVDADCPTGDVCPFGDYCEPSCVTDEECQPDGYCRDERFCDYCQPFEIACDGNDEDCNGVPDDGGVCASGCGDGFFDPSSEACDGPDLGGLVCADVDPSFHSGFLACRGDCMGFDTTSCSTEICDNDMDDDGDRLFDCSDPDCVEETFCCDLGMASGDYCDGLDNDCNGLTDEDGDASCADGNECTGPDVCSSGLCDNSFLPAGSPCMGTAGFCDDVGVCNAG